MLKAVRSPFTTGTIDGACSSYFTSAAGVPAKCFGMALMPMVQSLSCILTGSESDKSSVQHQQSIDSQMIVAYHRIHPTSLISEPAVLPANLGGLMNDNARLSKAETQSSPSSARRCAGRLPLVISYPSWGLNPIPIEYSWRMISHCKL